jgi:hypothetical protein
MRDDDRRPQSRLVFASGSSRKTSSAAPRNRFDSKRSARAFSSSIGPRATLTTMAWRGNSSSRARVMSSAVSGVSGAASTSASARGSSSSSLSMAATEANPGGAPSSGRRRMPMHVAPRAVRRLAASPPSPPVPMMRMRDPSTSRIGESSATKNDLLHSLRCCCAMATSSPRVKWRMLATTNSPMGGPWIPAEFVSKTSLSAIPLLSTLPTPAAAECTHFSLWAARKRSAVMPNPK